jgi:hypothetical protein
MIQSKHKWSHHRQCDYCISQEIPVVQFKEPLTGRSVTGCRHFRGGKSRNKGRRAVRTAA